MALLVLSIASMTILQSCGDDDDVPSPNPNPNDGITGQTIAINNQKWYVSNQSSMYVSKNAHFTVVYLYFSKEKEGNHGSAYLNLSLHEAFTPEYHKSGDTLNTALQQGQIVLDNVTSYNLSYQSGRIIYQGYDSENSLVILQLDNVIYSYSGTKQLVVDGIVKIKYDIN